MSEAKAEALKTLFATFEEFIQLSAKMLELFAAQEEALRKAGMTVANLQDTFLIPRLIGDSHPDLIGKYVSFSIKLADIQRITADPSKLTLELKRGFAKRYLALAEELKALEKEIEAVEHAPS